MKSTNDSPKQKYAKSLQRGRKKNVSRPVGLSPYLAEDSHRALLGQLCHSEGTGPHQKQRRQCTSKLGPENGEPLLGVLREGPSKCRVILLLLLMPPPQSRSTLMWSEGLPPSSAKL